jgi:DNA-binding NarL/FixJ family response regulator
MRIVVADDEMLTREGIFHLLSEAGHEVVGRAEDAQRLLHYVRAARPDAVIVDIRMPPTYTDEGLVAARKIRAEHPGIGVLVLSQFIEPSYALRLIQDRPEGVGYLLKERIFEVANLTDALDRIKAGETVIDPAIVTRLVGRRRSPDPLEALTARELEVLGLIAEGLSNKAIAARLFIAERTVETHVTQTFIKLGLAETTTMHRRVLVVLAYLRSNPRPLKAPDAH